MCRKRRVGFNQDWGSTRLVQRKLETKGTEAQRLWNSTRLGESWGQERGESWWTGNRSLCRSHRCQRTNCWGPSPEGRELENRRPRLKSGMPKAEPAVAWFGYWLLVLINVVIGIDKCSPWPWEWTARGEGKTVSSDMRSRPGCEKNCLHRHWNHWEIGLEYRTSLEKNWLWARC